MGDDCSTTGSSSSSCGTSVRWGDGRRHEETIAECASLCTP